MPDLIPGQLATVEFSLPDPPASLPTVSVILKKDADGVRSLVTGTSPGVLDDTATYTPAGNDYAAYFTVPADAVQGDTFLVRVVYTIGARQYSLWLVAGQVDFAAARLAAVQADVDANTAAIAGIETDVERIQAKITSGSVVVRNTFVAGRIFELRAGYDYTASGDGTITLVEGAVGDWPAAWLAADSHHLFAFHIGTGEEFEVPVTLNAPDLDGLRSFTLSVTREELPTRIGHYDYQIYGRFNAGDDEPYKIAGKFELRRGRSSAAAA